MVERGFFTDQTYARGNDAFVAAQNAQSTANSASSSAASAIVSINNLQVTVDGKVTTFFNDNPPTPDADGDLWFDTNDKNKLYRYNGAYGLTARTNYMPNPSAAYSNINWAAALGDFNADVTVTTTPGGRAMWRSVINSVSLVGNLAQKIVWGGSIAVAAGDSWSATGVMRSTVPSAITKWKARLTFKDASNVSTGTIEGAVVTATAADALTLVTVSGTAPAGSTQMAVEFGPYDATQIQVSDTYWLGDVLVEKTATPGVFFAGGMPYAAWSGTAGNSTSTFTPGWLVAQDQQIADAITAAAGAQATADGKIRTFVAATAPAMTAGQNTGDLWVDTSNNNKLMRWSGTAWVAVDDTRIASALTTANTALTTANGKNTVTWSTAAPGTASNTAGDIWFQYTTGGGVVIGQWVGTGGTSWVAQSLSNAVLASLDAGKITTGFLDVANRINSNVITADKIATGVLRTNLVSDPSFEEVYTMGLSDPGGTGPGNPVQWRYEALTTGTSVSNSDTGLARSGNGALRITAPGLGGQTVVSPAFPVASGVTYRVVVNAACLDAQTKLAMSVYGGNTPTQPNKYSLITKVNDTNPPYNVSTKALTTNVATITLTTDHDYVTGDWINVNGVDATFDGWYQITGTPTTASFTFAKTAADVASTAGTGTSEKMILPPLITAPVDPSLYQSYSWTFTPGSYTWACIALTNFLPSGTSRMIIDDVSVFAVMTAGGGTELTAAGLRLFDNDGLEVGAFVSNRPNYFSVQNNGKTVAAISSNGNATMRTMSVSGDDTQSLSWLGDSYGLAVGGTDTADRLWDTAQGAVSVAYPGTVDYINIYNEVGLFETSFVALPGRLYEVFAQNFQFDSNSSGSQWQLALRYTTDGSSPLITSPSLAASRGYDPYGNGADGTFPMLGAFLAPVAAGAGSTALVRIGVTASNTQQGSQGTAARLTVHSYAAPLNARIWVNDIGPFDGNNFVTNQMGGAFMGGSTSSAGSSVTRYTSVWTANNSDSYGNFGARPEAQLYQGYYSSNQGNQWASIIFTGNAVSGETGKSIATALSGATLRKVEVYLKNLHWYYSSGTAYIRAQTSTALITSTPTGTAKSFTSWAEGSGKWVDITSIATSGIRGITLGKAPSTSLTYYGYFADHTASTGKPQLRLTYDR